MSSVVRHLQLMPAQKTWTRIRPMFKTEFAEFSDDKLIIDGLAKLSHRPVANPIKILPVKFTRIQLFFYKFSKSNPIKPFLPVNFSGGFYKWIFHWKIHWKKFESYKKICLLVKFTVKKINPIKPRILQGKNLLVNFKIDFHKMKYYNQSYNYIAVLISIKGFNSRKLTLLKI